MIEVKEFAFTGYPVTDIARARAFYEGVLHLQPGCTWEHGGRHWIEYDAAGGTLAITNMSPAWKPSPAGPSIALEVADFDHAINELRAAGVAFTTEPTDTGFCRLAVVSDPDGNALAIHHRKSA